MKVRIVWKPGGLFAHADLPEVEAPPEALVDLCTHILWGVDDGPPDLEHSLAMLKIAAAHGTTCIVAAPDASFAYQLEPKTIAARVAELQVRSGSSLRIHTASTFHFTFDNIRDVLAEPAKYTINRQDHLLVEFPGVVVPPTAEKILSNFIDSGIVPIICQPERHPILQRSGSRLHGWISMGCMLQVSAGSLTGRFGKTERQYAFDLMGRGMVQVIASNSRDAHQNPPRLDEAWRLVRQEWGEGAAGKLLVENPMAILEGRALRKRPVSPVAIDRKAAPAS